MLPEKIIGALETGRIKDPSGANDAQKSAKISLSRSRKENSSLRILAMLTSVTVALSSVVFMGAELAAKSTETASTVFDLMLHSNFPSPEPSDIPVAIITSQSETTSAPETTPAPETTSVPETTTPPETTSAPETTAPPETSPISIYDFDYSAVPEGSLPIVPTDLSASELGEFYISNETPYNPNVAALSQTGGAVAAWSDLSADKNAPLVLIIHTHGTEAYSAEGAVSYDESNVAPRTENTAENVVAVGSVMAAVFRENGISTLHCTILHDLESYKDSYNRAAATIKEYLEKYPSIKYVFDIHRDSLIRENGEKIRPVTEIDGESTAQVMSVVGTDYKGAAHPNWEINLSLAATLQSRLNDSYSKLARHIYLRGASFNQQYTEGSLLLEIGSCGNTLAEAKRAGEIVAKELSQIIKGN